MLETVENPNRLGGLSEVPFCFVVCSGAITQVKILLMNAMLVDWQLNLKKKRVSPGNIDTNTCPYYQPSTQATELRTFFGNMTKYYDWQVGQSHFKNFDGALSGVLAAEFTRREGLWVSATKIFKYCTILFYVI